MLVRLTTWPKCRYCMLLTYISRHISSRQLEPIVVVAVGVINMRSTAVHCQAQSINRFDTTTATLGHRDVLVIIITMVYSIWQQQLD